MVLKPDKTKPLSDDEQIEADELEETIDTMLAEREYEIPFDWFESDKVRDYVLAQYKEAGWNVVEHKDNQYFEFKF